jgi:hypothetical protein
VQHARIRQAVAIRRSGYPTPGIWTSAGRIVSAMDVNVWNVVDDLEAFTRSRATVDPTRLADPDLPFPSRRWSLNRTASSDVARWP